jgi:hypothetical protein
LTAATTAYVIDVVVVVVGESIRQRHALMVRYAPPRLLAWRGVAWCGGALYRSIDSMDDRKEAKQKQSKSKSNGLPA